MQYGSTVLTINTVEVRSIRKIGDRKFEVTVVPICKAVRKNYQELEDCTEREVKMEVMRSKFGWYAMTEYWIHNKTGKKIEKVHFYGRHDRWITRPVKAAVAALVAKLMGEDHTFTTEEVKPTSIHAGCHNCAHKVKLTDNGEPKDLTWVRGEDILIPDTDQYGNDVEFYCMTMRCPILTGYIRRINEWDKTTGDRYRNIHGYNGHYEENGRLTNKERIIEDEGYNSMLDGCGGQHHHWMFMDDQGKWVNPAPKAREVRLDTREVVEGDVSYTVWAAYYGDVEVIDARFKDKEFLKQLGLDIE